MRHHSMVACLSPIHLRFGSFRSYILVKITSHRRHLKSFRRNIVLVSKSTRATHSTNIDSFSCILLQTYIHTCSQHQYFAWLSRFQHTRNQTPLNAYKKSQISNNTESMVVPTNLNKITYNNNRIQSK